MAKTNVSSPPKIVPPAKAGGKPIKHASPPPLKSGYSPSPKKAQDGDKATDLHKIIPLLEPDGTAFGWAFVGFFDAKEWLKSFCNRNGSMTTLGAENFMPFNNLSVRWVQHSLVDDKLWVIRIDATMSATEGSFPMHCHVTWANKIARAILSLNVQWVAGSLEVLQPLLLTEAETDDLESKFRSTSAIPVGVDEELFMEQIAAADSALEDLL